MARAFFTVGLISLMAVGWAASSAAETSEQGNLRISFDGSFAPHRLPRDRLAPITASVQGSIATTDGTQPPALRRVKIGINRNGRLSSRGLPDCPSGSLQSTSPETALGICRASLVGNGTLRAQVAFGGGPPTSASGRVLAFNGKQNGRESLLLHLYVTVPVKTTLVLPLQIFRPRKGRFGIVLNGRMPKLAGGFGSITDIDLNLGRRYGFGGQRRSYLSASCSAPPGFTLGVFPFAKGTFLFADGHQFNTVLTRNCRVR
jgi:hypothetical protein